MTTHQPPSRVYRSRIWQKVFALAFEWGVRRIRRSYKDPSLCRCSDCSGQSTRWIRRLKPAWFSLRPQPTCQTKTKTSSVFKNSGANKKVKTNTHTHPHTHRQKQPHKHPKMQSRPSCRGRGAFGRRRLVSMPIEPGFASSPLIRVPFSSDSELIIKRHRNKKVQQGSTQEYLYSTLIVSS